MSTDLPAKKRTKWKPFKTFLFCCDCCSLVSGCITVTFVNFVIHLATMVFSLYPFYCPRSFIRSIQWGTEKCKYLAALHRYSATTIMLDNLPINPALCSIFIIMDIIVFVGVTERKRWLIAFALVAPVCGVGLSIQSIAGQLTACSPKWRIISLTLSLIAWDFFEAVVLYSYFIELSETEESRKLLAADIPNELLKQLEFPVFDQDVEMIRVKPGHLQSNTKKSETKRDQKNVMLMLRPDILEINKDISVESFEGSI